MFLRILNEIENLDELNLTATNNPFKRAEAMRGKNRLETFKKSTSERLTGMNDIASIGASIKSIVNESEKLLQTSYNNVLGDGGLQYILNGNYEYMEDVSRNITNWFDGNTTIHVYGDKRFTTDKTLGMTTVEFKDDSRYNVDEKWLKLLQKYPLLHKLIQKRDNPISNSIKTAIDYYYYIQEGRKLSYKITFNKKIKKYHINCKNIVVFVDSSMYLFKKNYTEEDFNQFLGTILHEIAHNAQIESLIYLNILNELTGKSLLKATFTYLRNMISSKKPITNLFNMISHIQNAITDGYRISAPKKKLDSTVSNVGAASIVTSALVGIGKMYGSQLIAFIGILEMFVILSYLTQKYICHRGEYQADLFAKSAGGSKVAKGVSRFLMNNSGDFRKHTMDRYLLDNPIFNKKEYNNSSVKKGFDIIKLNLLKLYDLLNPNSQFSHPNTGLRVENLSNNNPSKY